MYSERYHKAAKDGLIDVLKEATRREVNARDVDGLTPVLWAAFEGKLDALKLLIGRGGDPDKSDQFGNTALHLAAAKGHINCVDFLVKFGINIYAQDIDRHTAKDLAGINNREDILRYLDIATTNLEQKDKKKAKTLKDIAEKNCEKKIKEYVKRQQKQEDELDNDKKPIPHRTSTMLAAFKHKIWSSNGNLKQSMPPIKDHTTAPNTKFSVLVGGTINGNRGAVERKVLRMKQQMEKNGSVNNDFKVGEMEANGKRSVRSLQGVRRDSEILYVGTFNSNDDILKRGKITGVFDVQTNNETSLCNSRITNGTLSRSLSQPDFLFSDDSQDSVVRQRPSGLFDRPMLGTLAFRRSVTAALNELQSDSGSVENDQLSTYKSIDDNKNKIIKPRQLIYNGSDSDEEETSEDDDSENNPPIKRFLTAWGLDEHYHIFEKQQIDLDTLILLTEDDLKTLSLPLGPFRKLVIAIQERKNALSNPGAITDTNL